MANYRIQAESRTHRGRVRAQNEDSLQAYPQHGLMVLADGMGGHNAGEVASRLAVETVGRYLTLPAQDNPPTERRIQVAVTLANEKIFQAAQDPKCRGMGTTIVVTQMLGDRLFCGHVGDSRLYRWRAGELVQLTRDHSLVAELVAQKFFRNEAEAIEAGVNHHVLTKALGIDLKVDIELNTWEIAAGDQYLLCSDGLSNMITDEQLARILSTDRDLAGQADHLLDTANEQGGEDNISLILLRCDPTTPPDPS